MTALKTPLVFIRWKDHCAEGAWADVEKFHGPSTCYSVGWIQKEDDEGITVAANLGHDGDKKDHQSGNLQYILKSCIVERKILHCPKI